MQKSEVKKDSNYKPIFVHQEMSSSYLSYAMSVIVSRALPDVRDGLKPVHRRIIYAMYKGGYDWSKPFVPDNFVIDYSDLISLGTTMIEMVVFNEAGDVVQGARVTLLMGDDDIFVTGFTDENGEITLTWDAVMSGTMDLTVIKRNHRPYEGTIKISDAVGAAVSMLSSEIEVNSGEEMDLEITLHNHGVGIAEGVMVTLISDSEHVTIMDEIFIAGDIRFS